MYRLSTWLYCRYATRLKTKPPPHRLPPTHIHTYLCIHMAVLIHPFKCLIYNPYFFICLCSVPWILMLTFGSIYLSPPTPICLIFAAFSLATSPSPPCAPSLLLNSNSFPPLTHNPGQCSPPLSPIILIYDSEIYA